MRLHTQHSTTHKVHVSLTSTSSRLLFSPCKALKDDSIAFISLFFKDQKVLRRLHCAATRISKTSEQMGWPEQAPAALHSARLKIAAEEERAADWTDLTSVWASFDRTNPPQEATSSAQTGEARPLVLGVKNTKVSLIITIKTHTRCRHEAFLTPVTAYRESKLINWNTYMIIKRHCL